MMSGDAQSGCLSIDTAESARELWKCTDTWSQASDGPDWQWPKDFSGDSYMQVEGGKFQSSGSLKCGSSEEWPQHHLGYLLGMWLLGPPSRFTKKETLWVCIWFLFFNKPSRWVWCARMWEPPHCSNRAQMLVPCDSRPQRGEMG